MPLALKRSGWGGGGRISNILWLQNKVKQTRLATQRLPEYGYSNAFWGQAVLNLKKKKKNPTRKTAEKKGLGKGRFPGGGQGGTERLSNLLYVSEKQCSQSAG